MTITYRSICNLHTFFPTLYNIYIVYSKQFRNILYKNIDLLEGTVDTKISTKYNSIKYAKMIPLKTNTGNLH